MRIYETIRLLVSDPGWVAELNRVFPGGFFRKGDFRCEFEEGDPILRQVKELLHNSFGLKPWYGDRIKDEMKDYTAYSYRKYDGRDFDRANFFVFTPRSVIHCSGVENGLPQLPGLDLDPDKNLALSIDSSNVIVPERVRSQFEDEKLLGLQFESTQILPGDTEDSLLRSNIEFGEAQASAYDGEPWYVLRSTIELPPVSPSMRQVDLGNNPVHPGTERENVRFIEPPFRRAEIRYDRKSSDKFPVFDLAGTWERWLGVPQLIASKRFYKLCQELSIDMDWAPVRIDED